jgi:hypothetical protein
VIEWVAELKPMWLMGLDWIRVSGFTYCLSRGKQLLDYALQLKNFCQERQFYTMVVSLKLLIRSGRPSVLLATALHL